MTEEKKTDFLIVNELPQVPVKRYTGEDGTEYDLITITEALKEILKDIKEIRKSTVGK